MHPIPVGDVTFVKASHKSPYGEIVSEWKRDGNRFAWGVTVPVNTTATVYVPANDAAAVKEGDRPASEALGIKYLRMEAGGAVYEIGSGSYHFVSTMTR
jgi:alpha-L-rhamnosidase